MSAAALFVGETAVGAWPPQPTTALVIIVKTAAAAFFMGLADTMDSSSLGRVK
ncbi:MAG: hypothetical protein ABI461_18980 [Polyangiaceae bacterium]